ncbi:MAG TPA: putative capsular polysaccharide synthesis family protein [Anaerolineae bacterium]|nr:putative capsular polysaccharide synthesis family protein [Anaerolineae bacterium]
MSDWSNRQSHNALIASKATRWQKLNRKISEQGISALPGWAGTWLYWNTGVRSLADKLGIKPRKYKVTDPIIVYQFGKVGSSSVYFSLRRLNLGVPLYHLHFLNRLDKMATVAQRAPQTADTSLRLIETARQIRREMERDPQKRWNLINLVRAPIPRLVSAFFQAVENYFPNVTERYHQGQLQIQELTDYFVNDFREAWALTWFQGQLQEPFGIDVYATPFDKARGYQIYEHGNIRLLVMRMEDLNRVAPHAMREFLGITDFQLVKRNVSDAKNNGSVYRDFVNALRLPPLMIEEWNQSQYAQHFYTQQELDASVARWVG